MLPRAPERRTACALGVPCFTICAYRLQAGRSAPLTPARRALGALVGRPRAARDDALGRALAWTAALVRVRVGVAQAAGLPKAGQLCSPRNALTRSCARQLNVSGRTLRRAPPRLPAATACRLTPIGRAVGFGGVALNYDAVAPLRASDTCFVEPVAVVDAGGRPLRVGYRGRGGPEANGGGVEQVTRITLEVEDESQCHALRPGDAVLQSYDLVAVRPASERVAAAAIASGGVDIISLDCARKLPFVLKRPLIAAAAAAGVVFEVQFGRAIRDVSTRPFLISNALSLVRLSRGRGVVFSSGAYAPLELRTPHDVLNIVALLGLNYETAQRMLRSTPLAVLERAAARRSPDGVTVVPVADITPPLKWVVDPVAPPPPPSSDRGVAAADVARDGGAAGGSGAAVQRAGATGAGGKRSNRTRTRRAKRSARAKAKRATEAAAAASQDGPGGGGAAEEMAT